jgi:hypothetical protein
MYPPPLFPRKQPERPLQRPQEDIEDIVLDEAPNGGAAAPAGSPPAK